MSDWCWAGAMAMLLVGSNALAQSDSENAELPWRVGDECVVRDAIGVFEVYGNADLTGPPREVKPGVRLKVVEKLPSSIRMEVVSKEVEFFVSPVLLIAQCQVERTSWQNVWGKEAPIEVGSEPAESADVVPDYSEEKNIEQSPIAVGHGFHVEKADPLMIWSYSVLGIAGAGLASGAVMGIMAKGYESDAASGNLGGQRAAKNAQAYALGANIGYGVAGAGVLVAIILMGFEDDEPQSFGLAPSLGGKGVAVVGVW